MDELVLQQKSRKVYLDTGWIILYPLLPLFRRRWGRIVLVTAFCSVIALLVLRALAGA